MRIFAVPAALLVACCIYMPLPAARDFLLRLIARAYAAVLRRLPPRENQAERRAHQALSTLPMCSLPSEGRTKSPTDP